MREELYLPAKSPPKSVGPPQRQIVLWRQDEYGTIVAAAYELLGLIMLFIGR